MITAEITGGLGNQLFEIFNVISFAKKYNKDFYYVYQKNIGNRQTYWDTFLQSLKKYTKESYVKGKYIEINEPKDEDYVNYTLDNPNMNNNILFKGYFQSHKYFQDYFNDIKQLINLNEQKDNILTKYPEYNLSNKISIHFRYGDYKVLPDHHPILSFDYYIKCLDKIINNNTDYNILYFIEENDEIYISQFIKNLEVKYKNCKFIKISNNIKDYEQMLLMSLCDYNIIANSSFSWFGAYFNEKQNVYYPMKWFGTKLSHLKLENRFPKHWNKID